MSTIVIHLLKAGRKKICTIRQQVYSFNFRLEFIRFHYVANCIPSIPFYVLPDPCMPNPCKNGGTCVRKGKKGYKCECPDPYFGKRCQKHTEGNLPFFQL